MEEGSAVASVGLCAACRHVRVIRSDRGLVFIFVGVEMGEAGKERPHRLGVRRSRWGVYREDADRRGILYPIGGDEEVLAGGTEGRPEEAVKRAPAQPDGT
jgi:hypothetical protein